MSEWDDSASGWDESAAVRAYADGAFSSLEALAGATRFRLEGATVCDFGCGTGLLTERLAEDCAHIDAVDTSGAMLDVLDTKIDRRGWTHVRRLGQLPTVSQGYDLIVCSSVLSFVDDYSGVVRALFAHLGPGGLFVQWDWELNPEDDEPFGLDAADIRRTLEVAGFVDVAVGTGFEVAVDGETMKPLMGTGRRPR